MNIKNLNNVTVKFMSMPLEQGAQARFPFDPPIKAYIYIKETDKIIEQSVYSRYGVYVPMTVIKNEYEKFDMMHRLLECIDSEDEYWMTMPYRGDEFGAALFKQGK